MDVSVMQWPALLALVAAIVVTLRNMRDSLRPETCPECPHCEARAAEGRRRQREAADEYARHNGFDVDDDDHDRPIT